MTVKVDVANPEDVQRALNVLSAGMTDVAERAAEDMVFEADRLAKDQARDKEKRPLLRTGRYFNSIRAEIQRRSKGFLSGRIKSDVKYAGALEFGSPPHVIRPRRKKALFWEGAAHPVKQVNHPGNPPFRVLGGAAEDVLKRMDEFVAAAMNERFGGGGGGR
ncbi:MAG: HK97 gp10 family phage protein [Desulfuromonadales bacterium]|nr:HK97 gp10 family phage protein [Desulfuromonadales bacterium]